MADTAPSDLVQELRVHGLITDAQANELGNTLPDVSTPLKLVDELVNRGWLTTFQAQWVLNGHIGRLNLGGYQLLNSIGSGGMGEVFLARQKKLGRNVALKLIRSEFAGNHAEAMARFRREAQAIARLSHSNIVHFYDTDEVDGTHFIVMEYVRGLDLSDLVAQRGPLPVAAACDYIRQAALGLQHAHDAGLVHRDIKPSNLLVVLPEVGSVGHGLIKILDLGLARLTESAESIVLTQQRGGLGTPDFVSPEQANNAREADCRSDLYSLGCTFYFLLTGQPPFPNRNSFEKILCHQLEQPTPITQFRKDVSIEILAVVDRLMAKSPDRRFQTASELAKKLAELLQQTAPVAPNLVQPNQAPTDPIVHCITSEGGLSTTQISILPTSPGPMTTTAAAPGRLLAASTSAPRANRLAALLPASTSPATVNHAPLTKSSQATDTRKLSATRPDIELLDPHGSMRARKTTRTAKLDGHRAPVTSIAYSARKDLLATAGLDQSVRIWQLDENRQTLVAELRDDCWGEIRAMSFVPDGETLIAASTGGAGRVWSWRWRSKTGLQLLEQSSGGIALALSDDGSAIAAAAGDAIRIWRSSRRGLQLSDTLSGPSTCFRSLTFAESDRVIIAGDECGSIHCWERGWRRFRLVDAHRLHHGSIVDLAVNKDALVATASTDNSVRVWSRKDAFNKVFEASVGLRGVARLVAWASTGELLTISDAGQVATWRADHTGPVEDWHIQQAVTTCHAMTADALQVAIGRTDGAVCLFRVREDLLVRKPLDRGAAAVELTR